jgi:hypothetical protein
MTEQEQEFERQEREWKERELERQGIERAKVVTDQITNFVNSFNTREKSKSFNKAMEREHRTLQQNFTRLVFGWIEFVASDEYQTDARNADTKRAAKMLLKGFKEEVKKEHGYTDDNIGNGGNPSAWLGHV